MYLKLNILLFLAFVASSFALRNFGWPPQINDYLLPVRAPLDAEDSNQPGDAPSCPHYVHGELRHSQAPLANSGGGGWRFDWLQKASDGGGGSYWTGSMVTLLPGDASTLLKVVVPLPAAAAASGGGGGGGVCGPGGTATVAETAAQHGCAVAINAGLFDPNSGRCLGNLVSDWKVLHNSAGVKNAHFGITASREAFFGYLTEDQVEQGGFQHLVGGAIWLIRNGTSFVERSISAECSATQTTGSLRHFATVISARSAVGQLNSGELVLVQISGKTSIAGINLFDLADLLIDMGVRNAINLDGGGSSTLVVNGTVVGSPSDYCPHSPHLACQRPVTSVLCVAATSAAATATATAASASATAAATTAKPGGCGLCNPVGGNCAGGRCACREPYTGAGCYERCRCLNSATCSPDSGDCLCRPGYRGQLCESRCERGFYGPGCSRVCVCGAGDPAGCDHVNGTCASVGDSADVWNGNGAYNLVVLIKRRLASLNWMVLILPATLAFSLLLNVCLIMRHCKLRRAAGRLQSRWRQQRQEMKRLVEDGNSSAESDRESGL